jgi:hypothetical protein
MRSRHLVAGDFTAPWIPLIRHLDVGLWFVLGTTLYEENFLLLSERCAVLLCPFFFVQPGRTLATTIHDGVEKWATVGERRSSSTVGTAELD